MDRGAYWGYFPKPAKSLFISHNLDEKEVAKREFYRAGLNLKCVDAGHYLGGYLGSREDLEEWVWPKVEAWAHGVRTLVKMTKRYPQSEYSGLGVSL